ncbi:response regulator [Roseovarius sp. CAU 1744]|uniref:response regulator n=1 Tax=Roseovarius sp. CAU 1744 TaxID=3140368 RepID=UPI00325BA23C
MRDHSKPMGQNQTCLVIEDSLFDQRLIERTLRASGVEAELVFAGTLQAARQALATQKFSMILCDNNLPDGNGTDFAQQLANDPSYFNTTIVIVSGWPSPFMWDKANAAGLQIIDKNDEIRIKLAEVFRRRLGRKRMASPRPRQRLLN